MNNKYDKPTKIDTSNLYPGMVVKNYKVLCGLIGEKTECGSSKVAQLFRWSNYFKFHKEERKQSYVIEEVYEIPLEMKKPMGRPPIYANGIKTLLLHILLINSGSLSYTPRTWWFLLGLVNQNYINYDEKQNDKATNDLVYKVYLKAYSIFQSVIDPLVDKGLITFENNHFKSYRITLTEDGTKIAKTLIDTNLQGKINVKVMNYYNNKYSKEDLAIIERYVKL